MMNLIEIKWKHFDDEYHQRQKTTCILNIVMILID